MGKYTKLYAGLQDFIPAIAEKEGISLKEAERLLRVFLDVFEKQLIRPDRFGIQFVDFITIEKVVRREKIGRNPRNPDKIIKIPERIGFRVNIGKSFAKKLGY